VRSRFRVEPIDGGLGGVRLAEEPVDPPYVKDYDAIPGEGPAGWLGAGGPSVVVRATDAGRLVGEAAVAREVGHVRPAWDRPDVAVLWDIRVCPDARGRGVGSALFGAAARWARARGCRWLAAETQNVNVPACRFYARRGCTLGSLDAHAYAAFPDEVQLVWYKSLA
jgi:GNAT superfamily N-acetyltransferase